MIVAQGRESAQAQANTRAVVQVVSGVQSANFSARGGAKYILEAPTAGMIVVLPPPSPSGRNETIEFMHRNANPVRYVSLNGQVNKAADLSVSAIGLRIATGDGQTGWFMQASSGGSSGVALTENGGASVGTITTLNVNDSAEVNVAASFSLGIGSLVWNIITGSIALVKLATQGANTILANATAGAASPTAVAVGANTVVGRVGGNIVAAALVNAQVDPAAAIDPSKLASQAADTFLGRLAGAGSPAAQNLSDIAGSGLTYNAVAHQLETTGGGGGLTHPQVLARIAFRA